MAKTNFVRSKSFIIKNQKWFTRDSIILYYHNKVLWLSLYTSKNLQTYKKPMIINFHCKPF